MQSKRKNAGSKCGFGLFSLHGAFKHMNDSFQLGPVLPWGRGVRHQRSGRDGTGGSFGLEHKANRRGEKNKVTIRQAVCGGWGSLHHRLYICTTQFACSSGGTCEAHIAASSKKAWQGLAGVGRQLKRGEAAEPCHCFKPYILRLLLWQVVMPDMQRQAKRRPLKIIINIMRMPLPWRNKNWRNVGCFSSGLLMLVGTLCSHWSCLQTDTAVEVSAALFSALWQTNSKCTSTENTRQRHTNCKVMLGENQEACNSYIYRKVHYKAVNATLIHRQHT